MGRILEVMFGAWLLLGLVSGVSAQGVVNYPPASGYMVYIPPSYPAPEAFGSQYVETFPSFAGSFGSTGAYAVQPGVPYATQTRPAAAARVRGRNHRATRTSSQPPAPLCDAVAPRPALLARLVHDPQLRARQPLSKLWLRLWARTLWFQFLHGLLQGFLVGVLILVLAECALAPRVAKFSRHPANNAVDLKTWFLDRPSGMVFRFIVPMPG